MYKNTSDCSYFFIVYTNSSATTTRKGIQMSRRKSWGRLESLKVSAGPNGFAQVEARFILGKVYKGSFSLCRNQPGLPYMVYQSGMKIPKKEDSFKRKLEPYVLKYLLRGEVTSTSFRTNPPKSLSPITPGPKRGRGQQYLLDV